MNNFDQIDRAFLEAAGELKLTQTDILEINPWKQPLNLILWGMALQMVTISILGLQYFLPALGAALFYGGARVLRKVNLWFTAVWVFSILDMALVLLRTLWDGLAVSAQMPVLKWLYPIAILYACARLWSLHKGICTAFAKTGQAPAGKPLLWAIFLQIVIGAMVFLGITQLSIVMALVLLGLYGLILHAFYTVPKKLGMTGYTFEAAQVKQSLFTTTAVYLALWFFVVGAAGLWANHFSLVPEGQPAQTEGVQQIRQALMEKGFPADILSDVEDADVSLLQNARQVITAEDQDGLKGVKDPAAYMNVKFVIVQTDEEQIYVITYFNFYGNHKYWHSGFAMEQSKDVYQVEPISARLLFTKDGKQQGVIRNFGLVNGAYADLWGNIGAQRILTADMAYPFGSEDHRGYVMYKKEFLDQDLVNLDVEVFNFCNLLPIQLPYKSAAAEVMNLFSSRSIQFYVNIRI